MYIAEHDEFGHPHLIHCMLTLKYAANGCPLQTLVSETQGHALRAFVIVYILLKYNK
jgi:hypothetical protein